MKHIKTIFISVSLLALCLIAFTGVAQAQSIRTGDTITIAPGETIDSMLFIGGNNIDISGTVNGDVYCAGQNVTISGKINGDVFCAGQTVIVSGKIDGSVRLAAQNVIMTGTVGNSATVASQSLILDKSSTISRDLLGGSQSITINGTVKRDIVVGAENLTINGTIGRNIKGDIQTTAVGSTGSIGGNMEYTGMNDPTVANGGKISGKVIRTTPKEQPNSNYSPFAFDIAWFIYSLLSTVIFSLMLILLIPRIVSEAAISTIKKPGLAVLVGSGAVIFAPVVLLLLFLTIIGIPIAMFILLLGFIILMLATPFTGYLLGKVILKSSKKPVLIMLAGTSILTISYAIPVIGFITTLATIFLGTGMVLLQAKKLVISSRIKKA